MSLVTTVRRLLLGLTMAGSAASTVTAQGPRGGRPPGGAGRGKLPMLEVTVEKVQALDPVAKLIREAKKLDLTAPQRTKLDSVAADLVREIGPFLVRIDSLTPVTPPRAGGERDGAPHGIGALADALAQVELRYQAALQGALMALTDPQEEKALRLVEKEVEKMAAYTRGPSGFQERRAGPPG